MASLQILEKAIPSWFLTHHPAFPGVGPELSVSAFCSPRPRVMDQPNLLGKPVFVYQSPGLIGPACSLPATKEAYHTGGCFSLEVTSNQSSLFTEEQRQMWCLRVLSQQGCQEAPLDFAVSLYP